jgi:predicted RNase H-like HicB family nuclease
MRILVLVEPLEGGGYRARGGEPFGFTAEGKTPAQAIEKLRELIAGKLRNGAQLTHLEIHAPENPLLPMQGMYDPNDPEVQGWLQAMQDYRREVEEDPNYL